MAEYIVIGAFVTVVVAGILARDLRRSHYRVDIADAIFAGGMAICAGALWPFTVLLGVLGGAIWWLVKKAQ